jgi:hypothetical protein
MARFSASKACWRLVSSFKDDPPVFQIYAVEFRIAALARGRR